MCVIHTGLFVYMLEREREIDKERERMCVCEREHLDCAHTRGAKRLQSSEIRAAPPGAGRERPHLPAGSCAGLSLVRVFGVVAEFRSRAHSYPWTCSLRI